MARNNSTRRSTTRGQSNNNFTRTASRMRSWLSSLARRRSNRTVTADDVHTYLDRQGVRSQVRTRLSYINSVLREPNFECTGTTRSSRPAAKGRTIGQWTLA